MSSWAQDMYDAGLTCTFGGELCPSLLDDGRDDYDIEEDEPAWFSTAQEALDYAKINIGTVITRSPDGNGYIIKK